MLQLGDGDQRPVGDRGGGGRLDTAQDGGEAIEGEEGADSEQRRTTHSPHCQVRTVCSVSIDELFVITKRVFTSRVIFEIL